MRYACAMKIAKSLTRLVKYKLSVIAEYFNIIYNPHNALDDAVATAQILLELMKRNEVHDLKALMRKACLPFEYMLTNNYDPISDTTRKISEYVEPVQLRVGSSTRFMGKSVVFTGNLNCALRPEAQQAVIEMGGFCKTSVSKKTDIVIMGLYEQDSLRPGCQIGRKLEYAYELIEQGYLIEILDENDFVEIINEGLDPQMINQNDTMRTDEPCLREPISKHVLTPDFSAIIPSLNDDLLRDLSDLVINEINKRRLQY